MCIDIVEIWFGIANGQITSTLAELSAHYTIMAGYYRFTFIIIIIINPVDKLSFQVMSKKH